MFNLNLTSDQIEFRQTVRDFVENEVRPVAIQPARLEPFAKPLLSELLDDASHMGLRTLSLSEAAGGAGADTLTSCIVLEELAVGDVDLAMALALTQGLAHELFDHSLSPAQRDPLLEAFQQDHQYHLALAAGGIAAGDGWRYYRDEVDEGGARLTAAPQGDGGWIINGTLPFVPNAPIAKLFAVEARSDAKKTGRNGLTGFIVARDARGITISAPATAKDAGAQQMARWHHGTGAAVRFENCRVSADAMLAREGQSPLAAETYRVRAAVFIAAINLGLGRAAYEAAVDYAKIRIQGGRPIIQHQAIGTIVADIAIKLELARSLIWKAAWAADNVQDFTDPSMLELPLHTMARVFTAEAVHEATLGAAECFGAMGVMRDMPLQKYVHDAHVFLYGMEHDSATRLEIAEALAGFERQAAA